MRICVLSPPKGRRWRPVWPAPMLGVYLNGRRLDFVIAADDQAGELWCAVRDAEGNLVIRDDEFVYERLTGSVRLVRPTGGKGGPRFPEQLPA